ncbi:type II toxin-antitoxin system VapC family toxin [Candidatus Woesearchaeota archaeon]|nr:type II toxin-antitoxin system VapC family toxin [Candidatus Woesearchaeota archaeon]
MIYLDTNIIIYAIENNYKYGKKCKEILEKIQYCKIEACCSILVLVEVINVLCKINKILGKENKNKLNIQDNINAILSLPIIWYDLSFLIIKHSSNYNFKVSGVDYIHVATMEVNSVFEVISADEELDKIPFLKRIDPIKFEKVL